MPGMLLNQGAEIFCTFCTFDSLFYIFSALFLFPNFSWSLALYEEWWIKACVLPEYIVHAFKGTVPISNKHIKNTQKCKVRDS